jgi:hypothetical protein
MAEVSNKTLAVLLVGAIVVSLLGTLISLQRLQDMTPFGQRGNAATGHILQDSGSVDIIIGSQASIVVRRSIDFGSITPTGRVNITSDHGPVGGSNDCTILGGGGGDGCSGLEIENDGNSLINVTMNSTSNASDLLGGTDPLWSFYVANGNSSAVRGDTGCTNLNSTWSNPWQNFQKNFPYVLCYDATGIGGLWYNDTNDTITVEFNLTLPSDVTPGIKSATIMFWNDP